MWMYYSSSKFHSLGFNFCELIEEMRIPATEDEKEPDLDIPMNEKDEMKKNLI